MPFKFKTGDVLSFEYDSIMGKLIVMKILVNFTKWMFKKVHQKNMHSAHICATAENLLN